MVRKKKYKNVWKVLWRRRESIRVSIGVTIPSVRGHSSSIYPKDHPFKVDKLISPYGLRPLSDKDSSSDLENRPEFDRLTASKSVTS